MRAGRGGTLGRFAVFGFNLLLSGCTMRSETESSGSGGSEDAGNSGRTEGGFTGAGLGGRFGSGAQGGETQAASVPSATGGALGLGGASTSTGSSSQGGTGNGGAMATCATGGQSVPANGGAGGAVSGASSSSGGAGFGGAFEGTAPASGGNSGVGGTGNIGGTKADPAGGSASLGSAVGGTSAGTSPSVGGNGGTTSGSLAAGGSSSPAGGTGTGSGGTGSGETAPGTGGLGAGGTTSGGAGRGGNTSTQAGGTGTVTCASAREDSRGALCVAKMLQVGASGQNYRIDVTEVTRGQYEAWLAQTSVLAGGASTGACTANPSYVPTCPSGQNPYSGPGADGHPVVCVDWCDAKAYCEGVGKRLCGQRATGGGANLFSAYMDASQSEWYNACISGTSGSTINYFPYGRGFEVNRCNGARSGNPLMTASVGSFVDCQSTIRDYQGVFDLSGNVAEWEDSCDISGAETRCRLRGGTFEAQPQGLRCDTDASNVWSLATQRIGFRCCADP
jgi:formylglycine-generating enzyme required for sulfatase activity